ncbi:MAG: hypothetical protein IMZ47_03830 [Firmicutes bacterium]|nr:hypothetical protein [Bacillota bacterium]
MNRINPIIQSPTVATGTVQNGVQAVRIEGHQGSFARLLDQELVKGQGIRFSKHAEQRLETRNIQLSVQQMQDINSAVERAEQKGIKDSLILMKDMAFIVNVPSRVVVTAIDGQGMKENIFTNIDGAVII